MKKRFLAIVSFLMVILLCFNLAGCNEIKVSITILKMIMRKVL